MKDFNEGWEDWELTPENYKIFQRSTDSDIAFQFLPSKSSQFFHLPSNAVTQSMENPRSDSSLSNMSSATPTPTGLQTLFRYQTTALQSGGWDGMSWPRIPRYNAT